MLIADCKDLQSAFFFRLHINAIRFADCQIFSKFASMEMTIKIPKSYDIS